jgi:hypothetical protein
MTIVVKFDPEKNFADELDKASRENTDKEIETIISVLNSNKFDDYTVLGRALKSLVDELDPVDKSDTIEHIFRNLLPEHRVLFEPVNIIAKLKQPEKQFGCFLRKRT